MALVALVPAVASVAFGSVRSMHFRIDRPVVPASLSSYLYAIADDGRSATWTRTTYANNATECGWVDGESVPVKPFGIVVYSGAKQNQPRRRRRLQAIAGGKLLGKKKTTSIIISGGGGNQQHQGKSPIDRRGKSDGVERIEYSDGEPIHFTPSNGFRRHRTGVNGTSSSVPDECRRSTNDPRRRILLHMPGNCHWGNYWHLMTECLHSLAHVMLAHNVTDEDDVHLLIDVAPGAGQLHRGASYAKDWAGQYINGCRGVGQTPWNCSLDAGDERKQWWEIMYIPSILKRRAVGLELMDIMIQPPIQSDKHMNRLHLYNSKTKESDSPRAIDLLADVVISGYGRLDVPGLTHNENSPEAFWYARFRILAVALGISAAESDETKKMAESNTRGKRGEMKKALYVSREHAAQRKVSNEAELLLKLKAALYQSGFELKVIQQEKMSVTQQVAAWNSVDLAIVERGAGMFNALFLRNGTALVYASNGGAYDTWTWLLPIPEVGLYKVFPVNALPDCTNFAATCYANVSRYIDAVVNATRYLLYS